MPYYVRQILDDLPVPVTADPEDSLQDALAKMLVNDYSQLPVVDRSGTHHLITTRSILVALSGFNLSPQAGGLRVRDAMFKVQQQFLADDDLFDLFGALSSSGVALIVSPESKIIRIVTTHDATQYFRQWSEDLLHARDVEQQLKQLINLSFRTPDGSLDTGQRQLAIDDLTPSNRSLRTRLGRAITRYESHHNNQLRLVDEPAFDAGFAEFVTALESSTVDSAKVPASELLERPVKHIREHLRNFVSTYLTHRLSREMELDPTWLDEAFEELHQSEKGRDFENLSLDTFIQMFLRPDAWAKYGHLFGISRDAVAARLNGVRDVRNKLAHFREDEISIEQRLQLSSCSEWLARFESEIAVLLAPPVRTAGDESLARTEGLEGPSDSQLR